MVGGIAVCVTSKKHNDYNKERNQNDKVKHKRDAAVPALISEKKAIFFGKARCKKFATMFHKSI